MDKTPRSLALVALLLVGCFGEVPRPDCAPNCAEGSPTGGSGGQSETTEDPCRDCADLGSGAQNDQMPPSGSDMGETDGAPPIVPGAPGEPTAPPPAAAHNFYVRPGGTGAKTGADWNNAWDTGSIGWNSIVAGDVIWLAGGTYTNNIEMEKSGSNGSYIYIVRALASDAVPTAASGWQAAFDAQVLIAPPSGTPLSFFSPNGAGSFVYVDGRTTNGIACRYGNQANAFLSAAGFTGNNIHDVVLTHLDLAGPGGAAPFNYQGDNAPIIFRSSQSSDEIYNITISYSSIHGGPNLVYTLGSSKHHITIDHCRLYDNASGNAAIHANIIYNVGGTNWTISNNDISGWQVEGIILYQNASSPWYIHGNVFHDPQNSGARILWLCSPNAATPQGPVFFYNNTVVGVNVTIGEDRASQFAAGSISRNNIFWNAGFFNGSVIADSDYNYSSGTAPGAHSVSSGANPFVNLAGDDFTIAASSPVRDKGASLAAGYARDIAGNVRGSDGTWDIGAYEFTP